MSRPVKLIGIPFDSKSSYMGGARLAPARIRKELQSSSYNLYAEHRIPVLDPSHLVDAGDIEVSHYDDLLPELRSEIKAEDRYLFLGGDHSITYPVVDALHQVHGKFHILHFDAHGDLYDEFEGDPHSHACPFARIMERDLAATLTQVGVRTMTPHQHEQAERFNVEVYEMHDIAHFDPTWIDGPLYISLDLDVLDPAFAPGLSHREPGGLSPRILIDWLQEIKVPVIGVDIVEYNPLRDIGELTASLTYKLVKELLAVMWKEEEPF